MPSMVAASAPAAPRAPENRGQIVDYCGADARICASVVGCAQRIGPECGAVQSAPSLFEVDTIVATRGVAGEKNVHFSVEMTD